MREKWLAAKPGADHFRKPGPVRCDSRSAEDRPITLTLNAIDMRTKKRSNDQNP
jgi:pyrophosphate--fructose-6-phosphate 1-phosphotransferase